MPFFRLIHFSVPSFTAGELWRVELGGTGNGPAPEYGQVAAAP